jgi:hypothetical protein
VNIYIPYTKIFVVKFQFKIKWILIILVSLKTPGRCARPRVKMLQSLWRSVLKINGYIFYNKCRKV